MASAPSKLAVPVRSYVRKYLERHLGADYVLSKSDRFGLFLFNLLRRQGKEIKEKGSRDNCKATFVVDLRNFPFRQYGLEELTTYTIYHFNQFVDELIKAELYLWVRAHVEAERNRRRLKDAIVEFMVLYDFTEEDIAFETLRKAVQRNTDIRPRKTVAKSSQKNGSLSPKSAIASQSQQLQALRQHLRGLPLPIFDLIPPSVRPHS